MDLDRPLQVTAETPRHHAEAYLRLQEAETTAARQRGLVHRFENTRASRTRQTMTVVVQVNERDRKAVTMIPPSGRRGGTEWEYIVSEVVG